jgi:microcystin-dependent protein
MAGSYLGDVRAMSFGAAPDGWAPCKGQLLPIVQNEALFGLLGTAFGGDGHTNFALPSLTGMPAGDGGFLNYCICVKSAPASVFLGEVRAMPFGFAPPGWMPCQGQLLPISSNTGLFSLLMTTYGGDGESTFALPSLAPLQAERGSLQYCIAVQGVYPGHDEPRPVEDAATCAPGEGE